MSKFLFSALILFFTSLNAFAQAIKPGWVNDIGGQGNSKATGVYIDASENVFICGFFNGAVDFDPDPLNSRILNSSGSLSSYVAKYSANGNLIWVKQISSAYAQANNMAVDAQGNAYVAGQFNGTINLGSGNQLTASDEDAFLVKYNSDGSLAWAKSVSGFQTDRGHAVAVNNEGDAFLVGTYTSSANIQPGSIALSSSGGGRQIFICKFNSAGNFEWSVSAGNSSDSEARAIRVDKSGDILVCGSFLGSVDFDPSSGNFSLNTNGGYGNFVAKYDTQGRLKWAIPIYGTAFNNLLSIDADSENSIYVTGAFNGNIKFDKNNSAGRSRNSKGSGSSFLVKYDANGTFEWVRTIEGTSANAFGYFLNVNSDDKIFLTGYFSGSVASESGNSPSSVIASEGGGTGIYLDSYDPSGNLRWTYGLGSSGSNNQGIEVIASKDYVYLAGSFCRQIDFDPTACQKLVTAQNYDSDSFLVKYSEVPLTSGIITSFTIPMQTRATLIDTVLKNIVVYMPAGTDLTALVPQIELSEGSTIQPASGIAANFSTAATYTVSSPNCITDAWNAEVILEDGPAEYTICSGDATVLTGAHFTGAPLFEWQIQQEGGSWVPAPGDASTKHYITDHLINDSDTPVSYTIRRKVLDAGSTTYDSFYTVVVNPPVSTAYAGPDQIQENNPSFILDANNPAPSEIGTWTVIAPANVNFFSEQSVHDPKAEIHIPPGIEVQLQWKIVQPLCGTESVSNVKVKNDGQLADGNGYLILYNAFSPNGDGINDKWVIGNIDFYPSNTLLIFNRWGDQVFYKEGYSNVNAWDGQSLLAGTYYYLLKVVINGQEKTYTGYIALIK